MKVRFIIFDKCTGEIFSETTTKTLCRTSVNYKNPFHSEIELYLKFLDQCPTARFNIIPLTDDVVQTEFFKEESLFQEKHIYKLPY